MALLVNSITMSKRNSTNSTKLFQKEKKNYKASITLISKADKDITKVRKLQVNICHEHKKQNKNL